MSAKAKIFENVLKACEEEYKDKTGTFNQLDVKAQYVVAFSGVLLGIIISLFSKATLDFLYEISIWCIVLSLISIFLLLVSIGLSIYSLLVIKIIGMPTFDIIRETYNDFCQIDTFDLNNEDYESFLAEKIENWVGTFQSIHTACEEKATMIFKAQISCGVALIMIGYIGVFMLMSYL